MVARLVAHVGKKQIVNRVVGDNGFPRRPFNQC
jgi:hypothetical protein